MNYLNIKQSLEKLKVFSLEDIYLVDPNFRQATLYNWEEQGKVKKIRNRWYIFAGIIPKDFDFYLIANRICSPSYISLELALNHYGIIPEGVMQYTSVTTNKTNAYKTDFGQFVYKSIREDLFWGYKVIENIDIGVKIADIEKAILDTLYFNSNNIIELADFEGLRYNKQVLKEDLDRAKLQKYLCIFNNKKLADRVEILFEYLKI